MAGAATGRTLNREVEMADTKKERFTTLSPILDNDRGKQTEAPVFNGDLPADNVGYLPQEKKSGKGY